MKVKVKTLQGKHFEVDTELDEKVMDLKKKIEAVNGFDANCQRLIYNGKLMENDATVGTYNLKEGAFIVAMVVAKPAAQINPGHGGGSESVDGDQENQEQGEGEGALMEENNADEELDNDEEDSDPEDNEPTEEAITALTDMGFPRDNAIEVLRLTGSVSQSAEILASGVPLENLIEMMRYQNEGDDHSDSELEMAFDQAGSQVSSDNPLAFLQAHPLFDQIRSLIRQDPSMLPSLLENLRESDPELYQRIADNQEAVNELLYADQEREAGSQSSGLGAAGAGANLEGYALTMTPEDHESVSRLEALGFNRNAVIEAYFTCDKNEELAANYLFDHGQEKGYEELMERAIQESQRDSENPGTSENSGAEVTMSTLADPTTTTSTTTVENQEAKAEDAKEEQGKEDEKMEKSEDP